MSGGSIVVYLVRRDLRTADNPVLHALSTFKHGFTHLLPTYVLPPDQVEVSGLVRDGKACPYPSAVNELSRTWKCGSLRAKFLAESVWDLKENLESLGSGLIIRAGTFDGVLKTIIQHYAANKNGPQVRAVWMTEDVSPDQKREQEDVAAICHELKIKCRLYDDQKYLVHDHDPRIASIKDLPDTFANFLSSMEPLVRKPRKMIPLPAASTLPPFPDRASIPPQHRQFRVPDTLEEFIQRLQAPVQVVMPHLNPAEFSDPSLPQAPQGGETCGRERVRYVVKHGIASSFHLLREKITIGDECHGLQSYLSLGCITARQITEELKKLERGADADLAQTEGFGSGCSPGTDAIRLYLLWINFIHLTSKKYGSRLYRLAGAGIGKNPYKTWKSPVVEFDKPDEIIGHIEVALSISQFQSGETGFGVIDAIMRQLFLTGQITPRAQMIVISFFTQYAGIDWRWGAEWVASLSTDHDASLHWYNWQSQAGVGPDPRIRGLSESPAHISFDIDPNGSFVRQWMPELRNLTKVVNLFRVGGTSPALLWYHGLNKKIMVTHEVPRAAIVDPRAEALLAIRAQTQNIRFEISRPCGKIRAAELSSHALRLREEVLALVAQAPGGDGGHGGRQDVGHLQAPPGLGGATLLFCPHCNAVNMQVDSVTLVPAAAVSPDQESVPPVQQRNSDQHPAGLPDFGPPPPAFGGTSPVPQQWRHSPLSEQLSSPHPPLYSEQFSLPHRPPPSSEQLPLPQSPPASEQLPPSHPSPSLEQPLPPPNSPHHPEQPPRRRPRHEPRSPPGMVLIPHPIFPGFLAVSPDPAIVRYYQQQLTQPRFMFGSYNMAPFNAPRMPHGDLQSSLAPHNAPRAPRAFRTQKPQTPLTPQDPEPCRAPHDAPRAPRAMRTPLNTRPQQASGPPHNAPRAPRAMRTPQTSEGSQTSEGFQISSISRAPLVPQAPPQVSLAPHDAPRAPRVMRTPLTSEGSQTSENPKTPSTSRTSLAPPQSSRAPLDAPRAPRAMRTPETSEGSQRLTTTLISPISEATSIYSGEAALLSSDASQDLQDFPSDARLSYSALLEFRCKGPLRMTDELTYHLVLQDYHQWRISQDLNPWILAMPPNAQEVMRYGLMQHFLNSLPPPPPGWVCPTQNGSRPRRKPCRCHEARAMGKTGSFGMAGSPAQAGRSPEISLFDKAGPHVKTESPIQTGPPGETIPLTTTNLANISSPQDKPKNKSKRGRRGKRGKKGEAPEDGAKAGSD